MAYWQDRMAQAQDALTAKRRREIDKQIKLYYKQSMERTIRDFENTYNKILVAERAGKEPTPADLYKLDTYWRMQGQLKQELKKLGDKQIALLSEQFEMEFFEIYYSIALQTDDSYGNISNEMIAQMVNQIWCADGKSWSERIWTNTEELAEALNEELLHCVVTGKQSGELKGLLQDRFNVSYNRADSLVRTELAHIQTTAAQKRYEDAGITKVQLWADEDERRCPECGKLHKKIYSIYDKMPVPVHPRCRCVMLPVIE